MLITFTCKVYENIPYVGDVGKQLLILMGQSGKVPGAIDSADIEKALSNLESGLKHSPQNSQQSSMQDEDKDKEPEISLAKHAYPLISMLKEAKKQGCDVMWE
jgi:hypothetical protein